MSSATESQLGMLHGWSAVAAAAVAAKLPFLWPLLLLVAGALAGIALYRRQALQPRHSDASASGTVQDVAASADPFQTLLSALPVGIITVNGDGRVEAFNGTAGEIFGVSPERAVGRTFIESVRSFEIDRRLAAVLRQGTESSTELTLRGPSERRLQVTIRSLLSSRADRSAVVIVLDRTRLRELESVREAFVSNVSHELRTPLSSIKIMVETLQSGVDESSRKQFVDGIARETERMISLVEDLLDLARLESGKDTLALAPVDLCSLCRAVVAAHQARAERAGVALQLQLPPQAITIAADSDKLFQVISNLLDNALKYTAPEGRVSVSLSGGRSAVIVVEDNGSGIPSEALPHVFERFFVSDRSRAKSAGGTGLGLAIVKHIVEAHGGTVGVESELGRFTRLTCSLPLGNGLSATGPVR
ncbi:MAG: PAS domain-containing protein [Candidatus Eremiobacteraeota bacterium]|nr:PAS domain-containing protein [Candidatus Eremiobacteraeota bacterium]MBC5826891.1 PAS domain-containing protein [Candidatus Eremiobacteraeota bacterium]